MIHVPLRVSADVKLRVANTTQEYPAKQPLLFNDCYEHAIVNDGNDDAFVLAMTMYHPDLELALSFPETYDDVLEMIEKEAVGKGLVEEDNSPCGGDDEDDEPVDFHFGEDVDDVYEDEESDGYANQESDYDDAEGGYDDEEGHDEL